MTMMTTFMLTALAAVLLAISAIVVVAKGIKKYKRAGREEMSCSDSSVLDKWMQMKMNGRFEFIDTVKIYNSENCIRVSHRPLKHLYLCSSLLRIDNHASGIPVQCSRDSHVLQACLDFCKYGDLYIDIPRSISVFYNDVDRIVLLEKGTTLEQMLVELDLKRELRVENARAVN